MSNLQTEIVDVFHRLYGTLPQFVVRAPGRVNLIGEHTDYNDGFVMPLAIDRAVWLALRPTTQPTVTITSLDMGETAVFSFTDWQHNQPTWVEYIKGVAWAWQQNGYPLTGWEGVMVGNVPIGAGLSSSAAVEMAAARAFTAVAHLPWLPAVMARLGQIAENQWMGVNCGIMDQMISAAGQAGHALRIDCRTLQTTAVPLPPQTSIVVLDTGTRRGLVDSAYNERRQQCETAAAHFGVPALRDVSPETFAQRAHELEEIIRRRARHVISENDRVLQATAICQSAAPDQARQLGHLMNASHDSLRDDFAVSSPALNDMVTLARQHPACYGARMTGAGFGGCAVALVDTAVAADFATQVIAAFRAQYTPKAQSYICQPMAGAQLVMEIEAITKVQLT